MDHMICSLLHPAGPPESGGLAAAKRLTYSHTLVYSSSVLTVCLPVPARQWGQGGGGGRGSAAPPDSAGAGSSALQSNTNVVAPTVSLTSIQGGLNPKDHS